jgi:hypothetical protein
MDFKGKLVRMLLDISGSTQRPVANSFDHGKEV